MISVLCVALVIKQVQQEMAKMGLLRMTATTKIRTNPYGLLLLQYKKGA